MKVLLIGSTGQLGTDLRKTNKGHDLAALSHADLEVTDHAKAAETVRAHKPAVVINTSAFHRTEDCEDVPEKALAVNALAPRNLARVCAETGARLVHFSTDYVFDGKKSMPYCESDRPNPLSAYGVSKLAGEHLVLAASDRHIVVRTAGLYGAAGSAAKGRGGNIVETIVAMARAGKPCDMVDDLIVTPTYTRDLAVMVWTLLDKEVPGGIYHLVNSGRCSWYEFARKVFALLGLTTPLKPVPNAARPSKIRRPPFSALASERLPGLGIPPARVWQEAVKAYLEEKGHLAGSR